MQIETEVTFLQMKKRPKGKKHPNSPPGFKLDIIQLTPPTIQNYRFLYNTIGGPWTWIERRLLNDEELLTIITHPSVEIYTLEADGEIAGFSEIKRSNKKYQAEIKYFGLMPSFIGKSLGRYFLMNIINLAWEKKTRRIVVNTCDLDHPRAKMLYTSCGFEITKVSTEVLPDPAIVGLSAPNKTN